MMICFELRFKTMTHRSHDSSIMVNNSLVTDLPDVLNHWADYFFTLGESCCSSNPSLVEFVADIEEKSYSCMQRRILFWIHQMN